MSELLPIITECTAEHDYLGHCPACHRPVMASTEGANGPVWACPNDLSENNPHHVKPQAVVTEELQVKTGSFGYCLDDFGFGCMLEHLPIHADCYGVRRY